MDDPSRPPYISLPRSLFEALQKKSSDKHVGLVFTSYLDNILFPLTVSDSNSSVIVGSSVIGATVVSSQPVQNLSEPIVIVSKLKTWQYDWLLHWYVATSLECMHAPANK